MRCSGLGLEWGRRHIAVEDRRPTCTFRPPNTRTPLPVSLSRPIRPIHAIVPSPWRTLDSSTLHTTPFCCLADRR